MVKEKTQQKVLKKKKLENYLVFLHKFLTLHEETEGTVID